MVHNSHYFVFFNYRKRGFPEELLSSTFAISSWGNGVVAIAAGLLAQVASGESMGVWV